MLVNDYDQLTLDTLAALLKVPPLQSIAALGQATHLLEREALRAALESSGWLPARAARRLGYPRASSLQRVMERHSDLVAEVERRRTGQPGSAKRRAR